MKVITTTGFYGTGSSAITDLFSEMDNVCVKGDYEFRIFCDPDGLSDLEYNLVDNPNRHNTSNAIKRFKKQAEFMNGGKYIKRYNKFFEEEEAFLRLTYQYIDDISLFKYVGHWYFDVYERGKMFWLMSRCCSAVRRAVNKIIPAGKKRDFWIPLKNEICYAGTYDEKKFLTSTCNYTDALLDKFNTEKKEYTMLDQLVPPTNLVRYSRYFSDIVIFVVERDPRDLYLLEKLYWKGKVAPAYNVKVFCDWYEWTRKQFELFELPTNALKVQFEDLIYDYNNTVKRIMDFVGIEEKHHIFPKSKLNPEISMKNTRIWKKFPEFEEDVRYIENRLSKYCYIYKF